MKSHRGFTLIEVLVTVTIIAVLATITLVSYLWVSERARSAEAKEVLWKAFAGYQRLLIEDERIQGNPFQLTWGRCGMSDPNTDARRSFDYTFEPNANNPARVRAVRRNDNSKWLEVDLVTGVLSKSAPY